jgi:DNA-binding transcriptional ArsR family regulator
MTNATEMLDAIAVPMRRTIMERLVANPLSVTQIADDLPISRSAVSQHLQVLKAAGLVLDQPQGTSRIYRVDPDALAIIRAYFDAFWQRSLSAFQNAVEQTEGDQ